VNSISNGPRDYRIQGPVRTLTEALKDNPNALVHRDTPEEKQAFKVMDEQQSRLEDAQRLPQKQEKIVGQVVANGEVVATVFESGAAITRNSMALPDDAPAGPELAKARLSAIAKAAHGSIRRSDFLPMEGIDLDGAVQRGAGLEAAIRQVDETLQSLLWHREAPRT
jgi:hypothetical protein